MSVNPNKKFDKDNSLIQMFTNLTCKITETEHLFENKCSKDLPLPLFFFLRSANNMDNMGCLRLFVFITPLRT